MIDNIVETELNGLNLDRYKILQFYIQYNISKYYYILYTVQYMKQNKLIVFIDFELFFTYIQKNRQKEKIDLYIFIKFHCCFYYYRTH